MVLTGRRLTPSGRSSLRENMRSRAVVASRVASSAGSLARSHTMISFLLVGCAARGQTIAIHPRSAPYIPEICSTGRGLSRSISRNTASLRRRLRQKSHRRGWRVLIKRARAIVARTSERASWAASCSSPFAAVRCSSLKDGRPSSCLGHSMPSGRRAKVVRTTSSRSQRPQSFCHSRAYGSIRLRQKR